MGNRSRIPASHPLNRMNLRTQLHILALFAAHLTAQDMTARSGKREFAPVYLCSAFK